MAHWDGYAREEGGRVRRLAAYYHRQLIRKYRFLVAPGLRVLEVGCGAGDLLAALGPATGVGIDFSPEMVRLAVARHPELRLILADSHEFELHETFDVIILSDLLNDQWDVQKVLERVRAHATPQTRVIVNLCSRLWELPLTLSARLGLARPTLYQNWLTAGDIQNLLALAGFEVVRSWQEMLWPVRTPLLDAACNRFLVRLWPLSHLALTNFILARPTPAAVPRSREPVVSVLVPARNESGNIAAIFARTPEMGGGTELVFVEGHSRDDTYAEIERQMAAHPERRAILLKQPGTGKGDAVRAGFDRAAGEVLMILDADLTVPPEDLPRFYAALRRGTGEFINGVRLVYPMEKEAMRFCNFLANKFFSVAFSWLLGQQVKDTLCGTKVLWKSDYEKIAAGRAYFGDFDLLFGAAKLNLKIADVPIRYRQRTYGTTNIQRWSHGWLLLRMVLFAARKLKFV